MAKKTTFLFIFIALIQILDVIIHAAANQIEIIRVTANLVILIWLGLSTLNKFNQKYSLLPVGIYLLLNMIFIAQNGLTNPQQDNAPRIALFLFVTLTTLLSGILIKKQKLNY